MGAFRILLVLIFVVIVGYTLVVVAEHGMNLFAVFFGDIAKLAWPGQFNVDFSCFLVLSALWVSWRNHFSPAGLGLAVVAFFGGAVFLSAYLLIVSFSVKGDIAELMLGQQRVAALRG
jgi:hypothetical protein